MTGKNPYWLTHSGEWHYEWLLEAKQFAHEDVTRSNRDWAPFADAFVFQTHQGYMFYYFRPEDLRATDPHFWIYSEAKPVRDSRIPFSAWVQELADYLPSALATRRRLGL